MNSKLRLLGILALSIVLHVMAVWWGAGIGQGRAEPSANLLVVLAPLQLKAPIHPVAPPRANVAANQARSLEAKPNSVAESKSATQKAAAPQTEPQILAQKPSDSEPILSLPQSQSFPRNSVSSQVLAATGAMGAKSQMNGDEDVVQAASFRAAYLHNPEIEMPYISRQRGESGSGVVLVKVSAQGKPIKVQMSKSTGFAALDRAACTTILESWTFEPARRGKVGVESEVEVPVRFQYK